MSPKKEARGTRKDDEKAVKASSRPDEKGRDLDSATCRLWARISSGFNGVGGVDLDPQGNYVGVGC